MAILPTRATLLATPIGQLRDWGLIVTCPCRGFPRHMPVDRLADDFGNRVTLEAILMRLRCERCRLPPRRIEGRRGDPFAVRGHQPVVLLESKEAVQRR
jgi:hypothetical protein